MTHAEAIAIRSMQLQGQPIEPLLVQQAIEVIQETKTPTARSRTKGNRPRKPKVLVDMGAGKQDGE